MADGILPDDIRVERSDIIQRAQMEWHFVVLSSKLYRNFKTELEDFSDRVKRMELFDQGVWDELKGLWEGVQKHIYDKNLFRDHSDSLKSKANSIFEELKLLRKALNAELNQKSKIVSDNIQSRLVSIEEKIASGAVLKPLFDDLKKIQEEFKTISINREDREILWKKLNEAFKAIREKREGGSSNSNNSGSFDSENNESKKSIKDLSSTLEESKKTINGLNQTISQINNGQGTLGKLIQDKSLYNNLEKTSKNLDLLLQDLRLNPQRYIHVSVFRGKGENYVKPTDDPAFDQNK